MPALRQLLQWLPTASASRSTRKPSTVIAAAPELENSCPTATPGYSVAVFGDRRLSAAEHISPCLMPRRAYPTGVHNSKSPYVHTMRLPPSGMRVGTRIRQRRDRHRPIEACGQRPDVQMGCVHRMRSLFATAHDACPHCIWVKRKPDGTRL